MLGLVVLASSTFARDLCFNYACSCVVRVNHPNHWCARCQNSLTTRAWLTNQPTPRVLLVIGCVVGDKISCLRAFFQPTVGRFREHNALPSATWLVSVWPGRDFRSLGKSPALDVFTTQKVLFWRPNRNALLLWPATAFLSSISPRAAGSAQPSSVNDDVSRRLISLVYLFVFIFGSFICSLPEKRTS